MTRLLATCSLALLAGLSTPAAAHSWDRQQTDVFRFDDLEPTGESTLIRGRRGVFAKIRAEDLAPGVYTIWWVIWNNPEACGADGCTGDDFGNPAIDVDIGYAGGGLVGPSGRLTRFALLREGEPLEGFPAELGLASGSGLVDAQQSEVHLVVRDHGEPIWGLIREMRSTFQGGCTYDFPVEVPPIYGTPGPNTCEDVAFAVFP